MAERAIKCGVAGIDDHGAGGIATTIMAKPTMLTAAKPHSQMRTIRRGSTAECEHGDGSRRLIECEFEIRRTDPRGDMG
jgi:hypothetical protein